MIFRHRPALLTAVALACGIYVESLLQVEPIITALTIVLLLIVSAFGLPFLLRNSAITLALVCVGALLAYSARCGFERTTLAKIAKHGKQVEVTGCITDVRETETSFLATLKATRVALSGERSIDCDDAILLRVSKAGLLRANSEMPKLGTTLRAFGELQAFHPPTNPHEYASSLALQMRTQTSCMLDVRSGFDLYVRSYQRSPWIALQNVIDRIHEWTSESLDACIRDEASRGFVKAVVLGDRAEMDRETVDNFTTAGVAHILAVSGFNVAIISLVFAQLLRLVGLSRLRARTLVTICAVIGYAFIVGWQPSVSRAVLMIVLYLAASLLERKTDSLNIIAGAAALELLVRPLDLFDVGFQLSYSAVLGLILIAPEIKRLLGRNEVPGETRTYLDRFIDVSALSIGASVASYPVLASHFYRISLVGFATNLPIVPLSALINALGFLLIPLHAISTSLGHLYGDATTYLTRALFLLIDLSAHVPHAASAAQAPTILYIVLFILSVIYILRSINAAQSAARLILCCACLVALSLLGAPLVASVLQKNADKMQLLFFDVGQGDCIYLRTPSGKSYFVDFGNADIYSASSRAELTALPFLRAEGETDVIGGFITHMHRDHFGGGSALLAHATIAEIFSSGERTHERLARSLESDARKKQTQLHVLAAGDTVHLDENVTLYVLHPTRPAMRGLHTNYGMHANQGSLAFRVVYGSTSVLFLGDVEASDECEMVKEYGDFLRSDVVKVAHHGSLTSSSKELTQAANARYAVISVGAHNRFGHPAAAVQRRWMNAGASVLRTDRQGAILLTSDGRNVAREDWR